ncbi:alpha/beta fold hydrolase [Pseudonocardia spinosispora]|uniref:alpha/beta fold hydrolase n=1 Tax=Pseudonocardia spinosispora TaxID=103441 RepID=UPI000418B16E|nr:alpha/beta hydrolase [Pseudonocardia spinosispora]
MGERTEMPGTDTANRVEYHSDGLTLVGDLWRTDEPRGTVVLLHGGGQTRHSWSRTGQRLGSHGWNALSLDCRGHGESGWAPDHDYSLDALVADLRAVVAQLGTRPVLVGASMGGNTSLVAQGEHPGLARALVLVDIVPRIEPKGVARIAAFMTARPDGFESLDEVAEAVHAYNPHRARPASPEGLRKNVRQHSDGRWYWHWDPAFVLGGDEPARAERFERVASAARAITVPTMLVRGRQSDIVSDEGVAELLEMIPHARSVDVGNAGHMVAGDDNDLFTGSLADFLAGLPDDAV